MTAQTLHLEPSRYSQDLCDNIKLLVRLYEEMDHEKRREFFTLGDRSRVDKIIFLMRWGAFELGRPIC